MTLCRITAPDFTAGCIADDSGVFIRVSKHLKMIKGKTLDEVKDYCRQQRWTFTALLEA